MNGTPYLYFDGDESYVEVPDNPEFSLPTTWELTIAAWIRPEVLDFPNTMGQGDQAYVHWMGKGEGSGNDGQQEWAFRMYNKNGPRPNRISFYVFNFWGGLGIGSEYEGPIVTGDWIHVVGAADAHKTYLYINGDEKDRDDYDENSVMKDGNQNQVVIHPKPGTAPLRIGTREKESYFQGDIREVRIWNRLLTKPEVADLYASNTVPQYGLVAEYIVIQDVTLNTIGPPQGGIYKATWGR